MTVKAELVGRRKELHRRRDVPRPQRLVQPVTVTSRQMHDHLQSLKVVDLRAILAKANVRAPGRKNEMIAKIQADPEAYKIYTTLYPSEQPAPTPQPQPRPVHDEAEKRRLRAERFGIPVVPTALNVCLSPLLQCPHPHSFQDPSKLAARAARFGTSLKRPADSADAEEEEKRRRRAERFTANASVSPERPR